MAVALQNFLMLGIWEHINGPLGFTGPMGYNETAVHISNLISVATIGKSLLKPPESLKQIFHLEFKDHRLGRLLKQYINS